MKILFTVALILLHTTGSISAQTGESSLWTADPATLPDSTVEHWISTCTQKWQQLVRSDIDSSLMYAERAVELSQYLQDDSLLFHSLRRLANSHIQLGSFTEARNAYEQMLPLIPLDDPYPSYRYHQTLGLVDFYEGAFQDALSNHLLSLQYAREGELMNDIPAALGEISRVFDRMGQPLKALQYAIEDVNFTMQHGSDRSKFIANYNLAERYAKLDSFDKAMMLFDKVDTMAQALAIPVFLDAVTLSKGRLFQQMGEPEQAVPLLEATSEGMKKSGNRRGYLTAMVNLGTALNDLTRYEESVAVLDEAYEGVTADGFQHLAQVARQTYAKALYHTGQGAKAYQLLDEYRIIEDSIKGEETSRTINELEIQYQTAEKERQLLAKEVELAQKTRERNRLITLAAMLLISAIAIYVFLRQRMERNRILAEKESEIQRQKIGQLENEKKILSMSSMIEGQEAERTRIAKDLHDGLGVLLSSVRRQVQNVQSEIQKLTDIDIISETEKMISTACEEVRRISHDLMPDALVNLGLSEAVRDLAMQIEFDHGLKTEVEVDDKLNFNDVSTINLYRIIQEAANNTIKYASASKFRIDLQQHEEYARLVIADNGAGFDYRKAKEKGGLGLKNIESRVNYLNGKLDVQTETGTTYDIVIPVS